MRYRKVPDETIKRLPIYLRRAIRLSEGPVKCVSSKELASLLGVTPWQIRKDLSYFGGFGTRGVGYNVENLVNHIREILRLDVVRKAALVGVGNLGSIAVPVDAAQNVADDLIKVGVKAILNFAPRYTEAPKKVKVITIDIASYLARLPYYVLTKR